MHLLHWPARGSKKCVAGHGNGCWADPLWYDFFYTELTTGLRRGEICALMWTDFDEQSGTLKVNRTLHREKGGRLVAGDTKTYAGTRNIVLPPSTAKLLRARKKKSFSPWIFHDPLRPEAPIDPNSAYLQLSRWTPIPTPPAICKRGPPILWAVS